ncbi:MAG: 2-(1,2-epoxy-1,2-dihydrophenyl)acetyl-CoA isomerase [Bacteroidetes bacterium]|nr:2-(1,2-epoxy-1,2-dihydrophenyl)acetyl-CoA isomerase [Bacteroidota bacterium]
MSTLLQEIQGPLAILTLNRPDKYNAFNRDMALSLQAALDTCADPAIRAVLITGSGKAFCSGQDLAEAIDPAGPGMKKILSEHYNPLVRRIVSLEKPVIAAVNGVAAGAGANLALCCDITVAAESASFIQAFSKIGLVPDTGGSYFLPRLVGRQKAAAWMMLGDKIGAKEAEQQGMIYAVYPDADFMTIARTLAEQLSQMPTQALARIKKQLQLSTTQTLEQQLQTEDDLQQESAATRDFQEGVNAFLEKRNPRFVGK